jgi:hypothetical protein
MGKLPILGAVMAVIAACEASSDPLENTGDASPDGAGGSGTATCEFDDWRSSMAGAVHHDPVAPTPGSWCPRDGIEICTDRALGTIPNDEAFVSDAGRPLDPPGVVSRCVGSAWQTVAGSTCEAENHNCNVFNYRDYEGQCCEHARNCERAFCDGERWWKRR